MIKSENEFFSDISEQRFVTSDIYKQWNSFEGVSHSIVSYRKHIGYINKYKNYILYLKNTEKAIDLLNVLNSVLKFSLSPFLIDELINEINIQIDKYREDFKNIYNNNKNYFYRQGYDVNLESQEFSAV